MSPHFTEWSSRRSVAVKTELLEAARGELLVAQSLARQGITSRAQAEAFFNPDCYHPADPFDLPGMDLAVARLIQAQQDQELVCVWGDFDVDGQTSTTILVETLHACNIPVIYHIPIRASESHGINIPNLNRVICSGARLILTCDTGVSAHEAVDFARSYHVDIVITDHHDLPDELPQAYAVVNPKRLRGNHPSISLSGAGVALQLARALGIQSGNSEFEHEWHDLAALGLVADLAELTRDTRFWVQKGLHALRQAERPGLLAMLELAGFDPPRITEEQIAFGLAPRLNALGRLSDANQAVELLSTRDPGRAAILAVELERLNDQRRLLCEQVFQAARDQLERQAALLDGAAIVLAHPAWPAGVIGIVASRLVELYGKPAILIACPEGEIARGSARSIEGVNIHKAIKACGPLLAGYGGHPMAGGFGIRKDRIQDFSRAFGNAIQEQTEKTPPRRLIFDDYLPLSQACLDLADHLEMLAPFGPGNPPQIFIAPNVEVAEFAPLGQGGSHLSVQVMDADGNESRVIWWGGGEMSSTCADGRIDLAYRLRSNTYQGRRQLQFEWVDFRPTPIVSIEEQRPTRLQLVDHRSATNPGHILKVIQANEPSLLVWGEPPSAGESGRGQLKPADALVIWTAPPGPQELASVIKAVRPARVYLFAKEPSLQTDLRSILRRAAGMAQSAIKHQNGEINRQRFTAGMAITARCAELALAWLAACGQISILEENENHWMVGTGSQKGKDADALILSRLAALIEETRAYRRFMREAPVGEILDL